MVAYIFMPFGILLGLMALASSFFAADAIGRRLFPNREPNRIPEPPDGYRAQDEFLTPHQRARVFVAWCIRTNHRIPARTLDDVLTAPFVEEHRRNGKL